MIKIKKRRLTPVRTYEPNGEGGWDTKNPHVTEQAVLEYKLTLQGGERVLEGESLVYDHTKEGADQAAYDHLKEELIELVAAILDVPMEEARELLPYYHTYTDRSEGSILVGPEGDFDVNL